MCTVFWFNKQNEFENSPITSTWTGDLQDLQVKVGCSEKLGKTPRSLQTIPIILQHPNPIPGLVTSRTSRSKLGAVKNWAKPPVASKKNPVSLQHPNPIPGLVTSRTSRSKLGAVKNWAKPPAASKRSQSPSRLSTSANAARIACKTVKTSMMSYFTLTLS